MLGKQISDHYIFHYHTNSQAETDISRIIDVQETCFNYISKVLGIKFEHKIEYYLCQSKEEVGEFYGDYEPCSAFARRPNKVYAVYNEDFRCIGFHEDAHLISYQINTPKSVAVREGLAMFFDKNWWGISNVEWVKYYLKTNQYESIKELMEDHYFYNVDCTISYPIMGCFTEYLIMTYGMSQYLKFYRCEEEDLITHFEHCYKKTFQQLEREFITYLNLFKSDEVVEQRIQNLLKND
ncbi:MAG TPA: hypothetical protein DCY20_03935 [Firmicutes bacterium]|nr:hypothetical protein [Bacillota bacterium]